MQQTSLQKVPIVSKVRDTWGGHRVIRAYEEIVLELGCRRPRRGTPRLGPLSLWARGADTETDVGCGPRWSWEPIALPGHALFFLSSYLRFLYWLILTENQLTKETCGFQSPWVELRRALKLRDSSWVTSTLDSVRMANLEAKSSMGLLEQLLWVMMGSPPCSGTTLPPVVWGQPWHQEWDLDSKQLVMCLLGARVLVDIFFNMFILLISFVRDSIVVTWQMRKLIEKEKFL